MRTTDAKSRTRAALAAYGVVAAILGGIYWNHSLPAVAPMLAGREATIAAATQLQQEGGPPLAGHRVGSLARIGSLLNRPITGKYAPVGLADDEGMYLFFPMLARATGEEIPARLDRLAYLGLACLLLLVYPLLFYELLGSVAAAVVAPPVLVWALRFVNLSDVYWISVIALGAGLPALWLLYRRWGRWGPVGLTGIALLASISTAVRIHSGLPLVVSAVLVALLRVRGIARLAAVVAVVIVAYLAVQPALLSGARVERDRAVGVDLTSGFRTVHPFWHNIYMGLGYIPNRYGITYRDEVPVVAARRERPPVPPLSTAYEARVRHLVLDLARKDPGFVAENLWHKARALVRDPAYRFWPALVLLVPALLVGRRRRELRIYLLLAAPALVIGYLPPLLTVPITIYATGWLAAWAVIAVLAVTAAVAVVEDAVRRVERVSRPSRQRALAAAFALAAVAALAGEAAASRYDDRAAAYYAFASPDLPRPAAAVPVFRWSFARGLPTGWQPLADARIGTTAGGLAVQSTPQPVGYSLGSPVVTLEPGSYVVTGHARVQDGGLAVGVLDAKRDAWIQLSFYRRSDATQQLATSLAVASKARVRILLTNWAPGEHVSRWTVGDVNIVRVSP